MRYEHLLLTGCLSALIFTGCIKPGTGGTGSTVTSSDMLVKSVVQIGYDTISSNQNSQTEIDYQYNGNNQKASATETISITVNGQTSTSSESITFSYSSGLVTETGTSDINNIQGQVTVKYYINSGGNEMDSMSSAEMTGGVTGLIQSSVYTYNSSGLCVGVNSSSTFTGTPPETSQIIYTYSGNDVIEADYSGSAAGILTSTTTTYTYNGTMGNVDAEPVSFLPIFFNQTFDLPASVTTMANGVSHSENYSYSTDSKNRVTAIEGTTATGKQILQETVTYEN
jgi:hypothetical protein